MMALGKQGTASAFVRTCRVAAFGTFFIQPVLAVAQESSDHEQLRMLGMCKGCAFEELNMSERQMSGVNLSATTLRNIDFSGAGLNIAVFDNAVLENVSFKGADLAGASFSDATLVDVRFDRADLTAAVFEGVSLKNTDLRAGLLCNTQMPNDLLNNSDCDWSPRQLKAHDVEPPSVD
jgi:uncharacterized protein YjbI with pentapeptide repeats